MAIMLHTFTDPLRVKSVYATDWNELLRVLPHTSEAVPPGIWDDISSSIAPGPRRTVLSTFNRGIQLVGELHIYTHISPRLTQESEAATNKEVDSATIPVDEEHRFAPVYQPLEGNECRVFRVVQYVRSQDLRMEDIKHTYAPAVV